MKLSIISALFAAALTCPSGYAQTSLAVANIPFNFRVGDTLLPAGQYKFVEDGVVLRVVGTDGRHGVMHLTSPAASAAMPAKNTVLFTRYGGETFLRSYWNGEASGGRSIGQSKRQRMLAQKIAKPEVNALALNRADR